MNEKVRGFELVSIYENLGINLPQRKTNCSAGYDFESALEVTINPGELVLVPTGVKAYMLDWEYLALHIRSSMAVKSKLILANGVGVVDSDYYNNQDNEGHIMFPLYNFGQSPVTIKKGDRIGQGIFTVYEKVDTDFDYDYIEDDFQYGAHRERTGGFGSTGV